VICLKESVTQTTCCASRLCYEHGDKSYTCGCWITQAIHATKRRSGAPEVSVINAKVGRCQMATKPPHRRCVDCQSGISCFQHMGICNKTAFIACDLCMKFKCHDKRCLNKICCEMSNASMSSDWKTGAEEVLVTKSKMPPSPRPKMPPSRVAGAQAVKCSTILQDGPAAPVPAHTVVLNGKKTDDGLLRILNEERNQVTTHTNLTQNASTIDCVRYFDIGKEKQERDDTWKDSPHTNHFTTTFTELCNCSTSSSKSDQGSRQTEGAYQITLGPIFLFLTQSDSDLLTSHSLRALHQSP